MNVGAHVSIRVPAVSAFTWTPRSSFAGPLVIPSDFEEPPGCFTQPQRKCLVPFLEEAVPETCSHLVAFTAPNGPSLESSTGSALGGAEWKSGGLMDKKAPDHGPWVGQQEAM